MNIKNVFWHLLKKIGNLSLAIFILLIIASSSILGTVIQQDQNITYYQLNYPIDKPILSFFTWKIIIALGLNHIYTNWWFIFLLITFFTSLCVCTFSRQLPSLKKARLWKFLYNSYSLKKFNYYNEVNQISWSNFIYSLNFTNYYVFHKRNSVYAYKGLLGRIAPVFVHISLVLILLGSVFSMSGGFLVQEMIANGESFHVQNIVKSGYYSFIPNTLIGKIRDFYITYNTHRSIQQFYSVISIFNNKSELLTNKILSVNDPLRFRGLTFYQTDWQINSLRINLAGHYVFEKSLSKITDRNMNLVWVANLPLNSSRSLNIIITGLNKDILIYNQKGVLIMKTSIGINNLIDGISIEILEVMSSTGLQIKSDPGLLIVYLGFFILMISTTISYLSYSQIWGNHTNTSFYMSGMTNRASLFFQDEFSQVYNIYIYLLGFDR
uniref:Cytochrome c biogenesis protein CcsB n=1 Tax=Sporolithon durum TaxID=48970 RepID=A0A141SD04_9FLOR|nr:c-type cytochrome biogenensis protein [Sporolithon durum]AMK96172.1 c-type cytochrome biogenensis protein [Sporolithon durum]